MSDSVYILDAALACFADVSRRLHVLTNDRCPVILRVTPALATGRYDVVFKVASTVIRICRIGLVWKK